MKSYSQGHFKVVVAHADGSASSSRGQRQLVSETEGKIGRTRDEKSWVNEFAKDKEYQTHAYVFFNK